MSEMARVQFAAEGFSEDRANVRRLASGPIEWATIAEVEEAFGQEHEPTYGHRARPEEPVELTEIRVTARGIPERPVTPHAPRLDEGDAALPVRDRPISVPRSAGSTPP